MRLTLFLLCALLGATCTCVEARTDDELIACFHDISVYLGLNVEPIPDAEASALNQFDPVIFDDLCNMMEVRMTRLPPPAWNNKELRERGGPRHVTRDIPNLNNTSLGNYTGIRRDKKKDSRKGEKVKPTDKPEGRLRRTPMFNPDYPAVGDVMDLYNESNTFDRLSNGIANRYERACLLIPNSLVTCPI